MAVTIGQVYQKLKQYEKDNYYLKNAEPEKIGNAWSKFTGVEINERTYQSLIQGKDPTTGQQLIDDRNGHRPGYNITFSPYKSFSVAAFAAPELKQKLMEAHRQAVRDTLQYMEKELAQVRQSIDGEKIPVQTQNILAFTIDHLCNRDGDVQIHTHVVVFNMSWNEQAQKWQALHSDPFKSNILEKVYENQLAHYLQERGIPVEWKLSESGKSQYAAISGVPEKAIDATSQRATEIKKATEQLKKEYPNATPGELKQIAAYETRPDKKEMTLQEIEKQFESRLEQAGVSKQDILKGIEQARLQAQERMIETIKMNEYEVVKQAYSVLSETKVVFSKQDLIRASLDISKGDVSLEKLQQAIDTYTRDKDLVKLANNFKYKEGSRTFADTLYTSKENLLAEKNIFRIAEQGRGKLDPVMNKDQVLKSIQSFEQKTGFQLTESQRHAVVTALTTKNMVSIYQGYAGTGKTESLKVIRDLAERQGYKIFGMSETNTAVAEMKKVNIDSTTVTKFLHSTDLKNSINDKTVLIVDECSFMGARNMEQILKIAEQSGARVLLFGDKDQLPPISAGFVFRDLQEKGAVQVVEMKDLVRYTTEEQRQAIEATINKNIDHAFEKLNIVEKQGQDLYKETANLYVEKNGYKDYIISTYTNKDKDLLNSQIRDLLKQQGVVDQKDHQFGIYTPKNLTGTDLLNIHNYQIGDKLVAMKSGAGVSIGKELTITSVDRQTHTVKAIRTTKQGLKEYVIDVRRHGDKFTVYEQKEQTFSKGDKILFYGNLKDKGITNSDVAYIKEVKANEIIVQKGRQEIRFNPKEFNKFDLGYASTTYKAQGKTAQKSIYFAPVQKEGPQRSYQDFYVAVSRAKTGAYVITNDKEKLKQQVSNEVQKESITRLESKLNKNFDKEYHDLQKSEQRQPQVDLSRSFYIHDEKKSLKAIQILPGISYQKDRGLIVSKATTKDNLISFLTDREKDKTFIKESKVILGKERGAKIRTEYHYEKGLLGDKVKGVTVSVNKTKDHVTITRWQGVIDKVKGFSRLANVKSESFTVDIKKLNNDLEKLKSTMHDKSQIKHIEKAQKNLNKLAEKADIKHYEKVEKHLNKAGIDLDRIKEQCTTREHTQTMAKSESISLTKSDNKSTDYSLTKSDTKSISKDESKSISEDSGLSRGR